MNKKLLSTAIAGVLAGSMAFAANADVTLFGQVDLSLDSFDVDNLGPGVNGDDINMNSNSSGIGVKGYEDLGGGLKAIFHLEFEVDPTGDDEDATEFTNGRDQWIGLEGGLGKLRFGSLSTAYKATGAMIDPFYRTSFQGRITGLQSFLHRGAGANGEGRATNAIGYDTPDFSGLSGAAPYSIDDECVVGTTATGCQDDDSYSLGGRYKNGPALAFVDYVTSDQGGDDDAWKLGGSYGFGDATVYGQYEFDGGLLSNGVPGSTGVAPAPYSNDDGDIWHLAGSYTMGNAMLYAGYGQGDDSSDTSYNSEFDVWTLAGMYNFSKRTMTYAGFSQFSADCAGCGETDHFGVGMRHKF